MTSQQQHPFFGRAAEPVEVQPPIEDPMAEYARSLRAAQAKAKAIAEAPGAIEAQLATMTSLAGGEDVVVEIAQHLLAAERLLRARLEGDHRHDRAQLAIRQIVKGSGCRPPKISAHGNRLSIAEIRAGVRDAIRLEDHRCEFIARLLGNDWFPTQSFP